jgi:LacI family transcriptional regulator
MTRSGNGRRANGTAAATIRDVARVSRVSIATVSRVFNDSPLVSEETRRRVRAAASRMGYWPNSIARSLITNRTHTFGVLMPDLHGEFFSEMIHGMDLQARSVGFHILVSRSSSSAEDLTAALRSVRGRVDGLLIMAPDLEGAGALREAASDVPVVLLAPPAPPEHFPRCDTLGIDNAAGAHEVVRHLIRLGHRRIAHVAGPEHNSDARQRREGYRAALREAGLRPSSELEVAGDFGELSGYDAGLELLERAPRPTAVFVANDYMAVGVMGALEDAGLRVPRDVALAGFDDIPLARYLTPPLTTVHVDVLHFGQRAVEMLTDRLRAGSADEPRHETLSTTLVVRGSCGAQRSGEGDARNRWNRSRPAGTRKP